MLALKIGAGGQRSLVETDKKLFSMFSSLCSVTLSDVYSHALGNERDSHRSVNSSKYCSCRGPR